MRSASETKRIARERKVLRAFIGVYCREHHMSPKGELCGECGELLEYAQTKLDKCPMDPKPKCKECPVHCYAQAQRERIREVMRFSGMYFVAHGRLDWLVRYFMK